MLAFWPRYPYTPPHPPRSLPSPGVKPKTLSPFLIGTRIWMDGWMGWFIITVRDKILLLWEESLSRGRTWHHSARPLKGKKGEAPEWVWVRLAWNYYIEILMYDIIYIIPTRRLHTFIFDFGRGGGLVIFIWLLFLSMYALYCIFGVGV